MQTNPLLIGFAVWLSACMPLVSAGIPPADFNRTEQICRQADALFGTIVALRRDFHRHPELSYQEVRTASIVADRLRGFGFDEVRTNVARHGVVAVLNGGKPGVTVAIRADMDALPIEEILQVPYSSQAKGVKHACGHDAHMAIALGVAGIFSRIRSELPGKVKFLFQPAEENNGQETMSGAPMMIREGALENPRPSVIFGLHVSPELEFHQVGHRAGPAQASADFFKITVTGKMAHAMAPESGVDTIVVAAECVTALQSIKSRRIDTFEPVILTIGTIHGGNRQNIIPKDVEMAGTVRSFSAETSTRVEQLMRETLSGVTAAYGASYKLDYTRGTLVVVNDPGLVMETLPSLRRAVGATNVVAVPKRMGAEDFSFFQDVVPGFFMRLGSGNKAKGITALAHTPEFDIDEECLRTGTKAMACSVFDYLVRHSKDVDEVGP